MGLLDNLPKSGEDLIEQLKVSATMMDEIWNRRTHTPKEESIMQMMREGLSFADILNLTKEQRDAIFAHGAKYFQIGELDKATEWMMMLYTMEPLEERALYVLGMIQQTRGKLAEAVQLYVRFLALDATNPEGYLRLGECFLAAREFENAVASFESAKTLCGRGLGTSATLEHAVRMLDIAKSQGSLV